jgi:hypothetical protein
MRQTFRDLVIHTPTKTFRWTLPWTFSTFDYPELCRLLRAQAPVTIAAIPQLHELFDAGILQAGDFFGRRHAHETH